MASEQLSCLGACEKAGLRLMHDVECCDSCHDEAEYGYGEMVEYSFQDGTQSFVCCHVREALGKSATNG